MSRPAIKGSDGPEKLAATGRASPQRRVGCLARRVTNIIASAVGLIPETIIPV